MSEPVANQADPTWSQLPPDGKKLRFLAVEARRDKYLDLIQRQVEAIAKFILFVNAGGAAAVLAAMAQKTELRLEWTLACYVLGIVFAGFALAASYYLYMCASRALAGAFADHLKDNGGWDALTTAASPEAWQGAAKRLHRHTDTVYWLSFVCFIAGSVLGGIKLLCR
jgi:hypothetical protein